MSEPSIEQLILRRPDDWHVHLRDGVMLDAVLPDTARHFARAIVMPNLKPPVTSIAAAISYRDRIVARIPAGISFTPLMTCYLTDATDPDEIEAGFEQRVWVAAKLYPAHATTNSDHGVSDISRIRPVLERMATIGMPLLVHGEVTDAAVDIFDREAVFIDRILRPLSEALPTLKIVLEHATTEQAVEFVCTARPGIAATITAHHLVFNRNAMFQGGIRPHFYCLPVAKRERHREALVRAATSGDPRFFLGTDSAPHLKTDKEAACGCAGLYTAPVALAVYAETFAGYGALDRLEGFASLHGPEFYGLPPNEERIRLEPVKEKVVNEIVTANGPVVPFCSGEEIGWRVTAVDGAVDGSLRAAS
jgi:dihydroorotase